MLRGIDISNHNYNYIMQNGIDLKTYSDFTIIKASEGTTFKDPYLDAFYDMLHGSRDGRPDPDRLYGFYHYARAEKNEPKAEADHFLSLVGHHAGYCLYALDVEGKALENPLIDAWAFSWCLYVWSRTGVKPLIYCSESEVKRFSSVAAGDFGLWVAKWNGGTKFPKVRPWRHWACWQYQSSALDYNFFDGNGNTFRAYCRKDL